MRAANGIDVMLLHQYDVLLDNGLIYRTATGRTKIVHINAVQQHRFSIYRKIPVNNFNFSKTDRQRCSVKYSSVFF